MTARPMRSRQDATDALRDAEVEKRMLGQVMQYPQTAPAYDTARCESRLFAHPVRRLVWELVSEAIEEGLEPAWPTLDTLAKARRLEDVSTAYLLEFDCERLPRLEADAIAKNVERLRVLADAREEYAALLRDTQDLLARPEDLGTIRARMVERTAGPAASSGFVLAEQLHDCDVEPIVEGVLEPDTLAFLWGTTGAGKSTIAASLAVAVASGGEFFGRRCRQAPVAMLVFEGSYKFRRRLDAAAAVRGLRSVAGLPIYVDLAPPGLADTAGLARVARFQERAGVLLTIVDTLHAACRGVLDIDSGAGGDAGRALEALRRVRTPGGVVLTLHHPGLAAKERMRGAGAILAAADTELQVDEGLIRTRKQRDLPSNFRAGFRLDPHAGSVVVTPTEAPLPNEPEDDETDELERRVAAALHATPAASKNQIYSAVRGNKARVFALIDRLRAGGTSGTGPSPEQPGPGPEVAGGTGTGSKRPGPGSHHLAPPPGTRLNGGTPLW